MFAVRSLWGYFSWSYTSSAVPIWIGGWLCVEPLRYFLSIKLSGGRFAECQERCRGSAVGSRTSQQQLCDCSSWIFLRGFSFGLEVDKQKWSKGLCLSVCPCHSTGEKAFLYCLSVWLVAGAAIRAPAEVRMDSVLSNSFWHAARNSVWQWQLSLVCWTRLLVSAAPLRCCWFEKREHVQVF